MEFIERLPRFFEEVTKITGTHEILDSKWIHDIEILILKEREETF